MEKAIYPDADPIGISYLLEIRLLILVRLLQFAYKQMNDDVSRMLKNSYKPMQYYSFSLKNCQAFVANLFMQARFGVNEWKIGDPRRRNA